MSKLSTKIAAVLLCLFLLPASFAITLPEAKAQGLVGEQRDGYVGLVTDSAPADVVALLRDVNNQRRQRFQRAAQQPGTSIEQVVARFYERAVEATEPNHFIQNESGSWVRK